MYSSNLNFNIPRLRPNSPPHQFNHRAPLPPPLSAFSSINTSDDVQLISSFQPRVSSVSFVEQSYSISSNQSNNEASYQHAYQPIQSNHTLKRELTSSPTHSIASYPLNQHSSNEQRESGSKKWRWTEDHEYLLVEMVFKKKPWLLAYRDIGKVWHFIGEDYEAALKKRGYTIFPSADRGCREHFQSMIKKYEGLTKSQRSKLYTDPKLLKLIDEIYSTMSQSREEIKEEKEKTEKRKAEQKELQTTMRENTKKTLKERNDQKKTSRTASSPSSSESSHKRARTDNQSNNHRSNSDSIRDESQSPSSSSQSHEQKSDDKDVSDEENPESVARSRRGSLRGLTEEARLTRESNSSIGQEMLSLLNKSTAILETMNKEFKDCNEQILNELRK